MKHFYSYKVWESLWISKSRGPTEGVFLLKTISKHWSRWLLLQKWRQKHKTPGTFFFLNQSNLAQLKDYKVFQVLIPKTLKSAIYLINNSKTNTVIRNLSELQGKTERQFSEIRKNMKKTKIDKNCKKIKGTKNMVGMKWKMQ